jgi:hypothetical protein
MRCVCRERRFGWKSRFATVASARYARVTVIVDAGSARRSERDGWKTVDELCVAPA